MFKLPGDKKYLCAVEKFQVSRTTTQANNVSILKQRDVSGQVNLAKQLFQRRKVYFPYIFIIHFILCTFVFLLPKKHHNGSNGNNVS